MDFQTTNNELPVDFAIHTDVAIDDLKMSDSPSPTVSNPAHAALNAAAASRRPPRKSTLTQQQKNQKRQRATQDQLATLELEFNKNPTPGAAVRERIAEDINMTERSVQIWFQNRRAKIKLIAKKSIETGEGCDIPESMRQYLARQEMEAGNPLGGSLFARGLPYASSPNNSFLGADPNAATKAIIHHFDTCSLRIGSWSRIRQSAMDLIAFYSAERAMVTYYIHSQNAGYKIEYPFASIGRIYLDNGDAESGKAGGITIEVTRPPHFSMDSSGTGGFCTCGDFTEDQQATRHLVHHLVGNPKVLAAQLAKLVSLDAFVTRHHPLPVFERQPIVVSAPVSPTAHRPASQPSYNAQAHVGLFQDTPWGAGMHPPPPRGGMGHKRQRSRSVPEPVNFAMLHAPTPSFFVQHPVDPPAHQHDLGIFAPIPHNPNALGNHLRIDTSAQYGMDFRPSLPLSASATTSDFASPGFFPHEGTPAPGSVPPPSYSPYSMPFLPPSASPLSFVSGDPAIVDQSPPHGALAHRSASADVFHLPHDLGGLSDDGNGGLNEMYSKHTINLPMHTPSPAYLEQSVVDMDMNNLVSFDSSSLSPPDTTGA